MLLGLLVPQKLLPGVRDKAKELKACEHLGLGRDPNLAQGACKQGAAAGVCSDHLWGKAGIRGAVR